MVETPPVIFPCGISGVIYWPKPSGHVESSSSPVPQFSSQQYVLTFYRLVNNIQILKINLENLLVSF